MRPAAERRMTARVNWKTTRAAEKRPARREWEPLEPSLRASLRSTRVAWRAGARPKRMPEVRARLADDAGAAGAHGDADGDFAAAGEGAGEEHVGDVGAGD